jgi:DNA-binding beta-propeller fold protein YncE
MSDHYDVHLIQRIDGGLDDMLVRTGEYGLESDAVRCCLERGADASEPFVELVLRVEQIHPDAGVDCATPAFVLRLLDDASYQLGHRNDAVYDDILGAGWRYDEGFCPDASTSPVAYAVTHRGTVQRGVDGDGAAEADPWFELRVWIAARMATFLPARLVRWRSIAWGGWGRADAVVADVYLSAFPPRRASATSLRHVRTLRPFARLDGSGPNVSSFGLSPDGTRVMAVQEDSGKVVVFETATGRALRRWKTLTRDKMFGWIAVDPVAPRVLLGWEGGDVVERDWSARRTRRLGDAPPHLAHLEFAPSGELLEIVRSDDEEHARVHLLDGEDQRRVRTLVEHPAEMSYYALARDAPVGVSGDAQGHVALWSLRDGTVWRTNVTRERIVSVAVAHDGARVYALVDASTVHVLDGATGQTVHTAATRGRNYGRLVLTPDNRALLVCYGNDIHMLDVDSWEWVRRLQTPAPVFGYFGARFSRDGQVLALCDSRAIEIFRLDPPSGAAAAPA